MTETEALEKKQHRSKNGDVLPEPTREDEFDHTYREKEGPKPAKIIVWKNVILMSLLHLSAVYAIFLIPSASALTLLWCEYEKRLDISAPFVNFLCLKKKKKSIEHAILCSWASNLILPLVQICA